MDMNMEEMIVAMAGVFVIASIIGIVLYLIGAIARYRYLRIRSYDNAWMAFIPIINVWAIVEATYGRRDTINIYGWDAPADVLKLWPIVTYALSLTINIVPYVGNALSLLLYILNMAVMVMIFKDMMEQLDRPKETVTAVIVVFFRVIADIMILIETVRFNPGEQNWQTDNRVLNSQTAIGGPLAFLNGKK